MFSQVHFSLNDVCKMAEECANQRSGELSVSNLASAVAYAAREFSTSKLSVEAIHILGKFIEPEVNIQGFRKLPVFIDGRMAGVNPDSINNALEALCEAYNDLRMNTYDLYQEFETIHPFADGNGRVGFVLFNIDNITSSKGLKPTPRYVVR